jgi:SAM-dependent methyltransferase
MAFNSLMIRLAAETLALAPAQPSIIELGNQTFKPRGGILAEVERYLSAVPGASDMAAFRKVTQAEGEILASDYLKAIGYGGYACIDVNDRYGALQMDLNENLAERYGYKDRFDVVTNNGTGEHVFDQAAVFRNMHALTKDHGIMIHVLPFHNYTNHGFYCFQPGLFYDLAQANGYEMLRLSVATAIGDEITFADKAPSRTTRPIKTYPLRDAIARTTAWPGWRDVNAAHLKRSRARLGSALRSLGFKRANLLVVAIMRKSGDAPFRTPMQGMYAGANISAKEIAEAYG